MSMDIKFEGLDEVFNSMDELADTAKLEKALSKACLLVERTAKQKAPKGNGDLRRSITSEVVSNENEIRGEVYTPLEYAPYVEFGTGLFAEDGGRMDVPWNYRDDEGNWHSTSGMKPHPYMRPALDENRESIFKAIQEGVQID